MERPVTRVRFGLGTHRVNTIRLARLGSIRFSVVACLGLAKGCSAPRASVQSTLFACDVHSIITSNQTLAVPMLKFRITSTEFVAKLASASGG